MNALIWWLEWLLLTILGSIIVTTSAWMASSYKYGYSLSFDLDFACIVGMLIGGFLSIMGSLICFKSNAKAYVIQSKAFGVAWVVAIGTTMLTHIIVAVIPTVCFYIGTLVIVSRNKHPVYEKGRCQRCGYPLIGLPEPRCPECGEPFDRIGSGDDHGRSE